MSLEVISRTPAFPARSTPLLFVHGALHGAWCWDERFLKYFASQGYAAHALSLRGHGKSDGVQELRRAHITDFVEDVAQVAAGLPAAPVVIGHSLGCFVVQKYLEEHDAPAGVLLASSPPKGVLGDLLRIARQRPIVALKVFLTQSAKQFIATPSLARQMFFSSDIPDDLLNRYHRQMGEESFAGFLEMTSPLFLKPERVKAPMLVIGAANDWVIAPGGIQATARAYHTQAMMIPGVAHDVMLEAGWQTVAMQILDWLAMRGI